MKGDRLSVKEHHTRIARQVVELLWPRMVDRYVVSVGGESGAGKSEIAHELARLLGEGGRPAAVIQMDDYFVFPPKTNHEMRRRNIEQVGQYEVKLDFMQSNLRSFKQGESLLYKPLVIYDEDRITTELLDVGDKSALIVEGTYVTALDFVDCRVFIDRTYRDTEMQRLSRGRDRIEGFIADVLEREHRIVCEQRNLADLVVRRDFSGVDVFPAEGGGG